MLERFSADTYGNPALVKHYEGMIGSMTKISAVTGQVYQSADRSVIVKKASVGRRRVLKEMHRSGNRTETLRNPVTGGVTLVVPNHLLEAVMPMFLREKLKGFTPSTLVVNRVAYDRPNNTVYYEQERLETPFYERMSQDDLLGLIFQVAHFLAVGQALFQFNHWDLHDKNVLLRRKDVETIYAHHLPDGGIVYSRPPFDAVVIDMSFSTVVHGDTQVIPKAPFYRHEDNREVADYFQHNPWYDLGFFLLSVGRTIGEKDGSDIRALMDWMLSTYGIDDTEEYRPYLGGKVPMRYFPETYMDGRIRSPSPVEFMRILMRMRTDGEVPLDDLEHLQRALADAPFIVSSSIVRNKKVQHWPWPVDPSLSVPRQLAYSASGAQDSFDGIVIKTVDHLTERFDFARFISTYEEGSEPFPGKAFQLPPYHLEAVIVEADVGKAIGNGYRLLIECCRVDPRAYCQKIRGGVVMNGGPFSDTYSDEMSYLPIRADSVPRQWQANYGVISIDRDGMLRIDQLSHFRAPPDPKFGPYTHIVTGPVLIHDGRPTLDHNALLNQTVEHRNARVPKWDCVDPDSQSRYHDLIHVKGRRYLNCQKMRSQPGQLSHGTKRQSRTALGLRRSGGKQVILFIGVHETQEREYPTEGVDLWQLTNLGLDLGLDQMIAMDANNPESAQICWRNPDSDVVRIANADHLYAYPVGNVLALVKM